MAFPFKMKLAIFDDKYARRVTYQYIDSLKDMEEIHANTWAPDKESQKFWKLGGFGTNALPNGCLRHDGNYEEAHGIFIDIDGLMPLTEAEDRLNPLCLMWWLHTTASHMMPGKGDRYRLIFPLSKPYLPSDCVRFVARINGVLACAVTRESFTRSTAFKFGNIIGQPPSKTYISDGEEFIDDRDDLDATAQPYRAPAGQAGPAGQGRPDFESMDEAELSDAVRGGQYGYEPAKFLIILWEAQDIPEADAITNLEALFDAVAPADRRSKWANQRKSIPRWVQVGYARAQKRRGKQFSALVDYLENVLKVFRFNSFSRRVEVAEPFPPALGQMAPGANGQAIIYRAFEDPSDTLETLIHAQANGFPRATKGSIFDALMLAAARHAAHPVRDWFNTLEWDGEERCDRFFLDYIPCTVPGRERNDPEWQKQAAIYLKSIGRCFLIGAVARIFRPGCKLDTLPVLVGAQGLLKSRGLQSLVPDPTWFTDDIPVNVVDKDAKQALDGKWIVELAEIPHMRREVDRTKAFLSRQTDRYRVPYGRVPGDFPRQIVFIGTCNELELPDVTGNRRIWPAQLDGMVKDELIARDREQLFAEALHRYRAGENWWLTPEVEKIAREVQDFYVETDVRDEAIMEWIDLAFPPKRPHGLVMDERQIRFSVRQILEYALGLAISAKDNDDKRPLASSADEKRVIRRLRKLGYQPDLHRLRGDNRQRFWVPKEWAS